MRYFLLLILVNSLSNLLSQQDSCKDAASDNILFITEYMPYCKFDSCMNYANYQEKKRCGEMAMLQFFIQHFRIPRLFRSSCVSGRVITRFVVTKEGCMEQFEVLRSPHPAFSEEVLRVMQLLPEPWQPGIHQGQPVDTYMTIPFRLAFE